MALKFDAPATSGSTKPKQPAQTQSKPPAKLSQWQPQQWQPRKQGSAAAKTSEWQPPRRVGQSSQPSYHPQNPLKDRDEARQRAAEPSKESGTLLGIGQNPKGFGGGTKVSDFFGSTKDLAGVRDTADPKENIWGQQTTSGKAAAKEERQAKAKAMEGRPGYSSDESKELTWDLYNKLSDDSKRMVDFNTLLSEAITRDKGNLKMDINSDGRVTRGEAGTYGGKMDVPVGKENDLYSPNVDSLLQSMQLPTDKIDDYISGDNFFTEQEIGGEVATDRKALVGTQVDAMRKLDSILAAGVPAVDGGPIVPVSLSNTESNRLGELIDTMRTARPGDEPLLARTDLSRLVLPEDAARYKSYEDLLPQLMASGALPVDLKDQAKMDIVLEQVGVPGFEGWSEYLDSLTQTAGGG